MPITPEHLIALAESFDWSAWQARFTDVLDQHERNVVTLGGEAMAKELGSPFSLDDPFATSFMTSYVGERIVTLDATTRDQVAALIRRTLDGASDIESLTPSALGDLIGDAVREQFDGFADWRADTIARTETAIAYNHGTVLGVHQAGTTRVIVSDGDDDAECAAADGQIWRIEDALANPVAHPNCTRAFAPYVDDSD